MRKDARPWKGTSVLFADTRGATLLRRLRTQNAPRTARECREPASLNCRYGSVCSPDDTLSLDNGGVSGPDYCPSGGSAGDSQSHSASALVSGFQPLTRLSGPRYGAYSY